LDRGYPFKIIIIAIDEIHNIGKSRFSFTVTGPLNSSSNYMKLNKPVDVERTGPRETLDMPQGRGLLDNATQ
jgi:hypothetical protein